MVENSVAENVLGTIGTVLWCIQLVPQIIRNYKVKNCEGFPPLMALLWAASGVPFSIYFIATDGSVPLRIQPQLFTFFCTMTFCQSLYYPPVSMKLRKILFCVIPFVLISIGMEVGFILWLRPLHRRGVTWPTLIIGIVASVLLALGLLPPYLELFKRQGRVIGINFIFLSMDSLGALFSTLSVAFGKMDVLGMVLYLIVLALELGIFTSHIIWMLRFRVFNKNKQRDDEEKSFQSKEDNESLNCSEEAIVEELPTDPVNLVTDSANELNGKGKKSSSVDKPFALAPTEKLSSEEPTETMIEKF